jgi:hypothetical protein
VTACRCPACCDKPDPKYTEEHKRKCEINTVLTMTKEARAGYYAKVAKARGEPAARALMAEASAEWARRSASRFPASR